LRRGGSSRPDGHWPTAAIVPNICDIAILPTHQGRGLGAEIIRNLVKQSQGHKKVILYSVPGQEAFYEKLGFRHMTTVMAIFDNPQRALESGLICE